MRGVVEQRVLVAADVLDADALDVLEGGAEVDRIGDVAGAGFEARCPPIRRCRPKEGQGGS